MKPANLKSLYLSVLMAASVAAGGSSMPAEERRPNVIFILADDVSARELSIYDGDIPMPNLDRMAEQGVQFHTAWAAPKCAPTRAVLMTGKYPYNTGYWNNSGQNMADPSTPFFEDERHLPLLEMARQAGYTTGWFGKIHNGEPEDMKALGVDTYLTYRRWPGYEGPLQKKGPQHADHMYGVSWYWYPGIIVDGEGLPTTPEQFGPDLELDYLLDFVAENRDRPFVAYWPSNLPHKAYDPETGKWYYTDVPELDAEGNWTGGKVPGSLEATMHYFDFLLGRLNAALKKEGLADNTVVFFAGDNGTAGKDKGLYDGDRALRVPFVVGGGPVARQGLTHTLIDFTDIWPTVARLTGYDGPMNTDGYGFAPLLLGEPYEPRGFCRMAMHNARWMRTQKWLLDGRGHLYDVEGAQSREDYVDVTGSDDPEVRVARRRLQAHLDKFMPLPEGVDWGRNKVDVYQPSSE